MKDRVLGERAANTLLSIASGDSPERRLDLDSRILATSAAAMAEGREGTIYTVRELLESARDIDMGLLAPKL